jgi:hypothetical protein
LCYFDGPENKLSTLFRLGNGLKCLEELVAVVRPKSDVDVPLVLLLLNVYHEEADTCEKKTTGLFMYVLLSLCQSHASTGVIEGRFCFQENGEATMQGDRPNVPRKGSFIGFGNIREWPVVIGLTLRYFQTFDYAPNHQFDSRSQIVV